MFIACQSSVLKLTSTKCTGYITNTPQFKALDVSSWISASDHSTTCNVTLLVIAIDFCFPKATTRVTASRWTFSGQLKFLRWYLNQYPFLLLEFRKQKNVPSILPSLLVTVKYPVRFLVKHFPMTSSTHAHIDKLLKGTCAYQIFVASFSCQVNTTVSCLQNLPETTKCNISTLECQKKLINIIRTG